MHANDTSGNLNSTNLNIYQISKNTSIINLTLDGINDNITVEINSIINITSNIIRPVTGNLKIYRNGLEIKTGMAPQSILESFDTIGIYNITAVYEGDWNHNQSNKSYFVTVQDTQDPVLIKLEPEDILKINKSATFNVTVNATDNNIVAEVWGRFWNNVLDIIFDFINIWVEII